MVSKHNIIFDLEATCWDDRRPEADIPKEGTPEYAQFILETYWQNNDMETIQIGAVKVHYKTMDIISEFNIFIKPVIHPILSDFCINLTNIQQSTIDTSGVQYREAFEKFVDWADNPRTYIGWGGGDYTLLHTDCSRHHKRTKETFRCFPRYKYVNGKSLYQYWVGIRSKSLKLSVNRANIKFEGEQHDALVDAKATVKVLRDAWINF